MLGISGGDPAFREDDGSAEPAVSTALAAFSAGQGSEAAVLEALAGTRLLVPVMAVLAEQLEPDSRPAVAQAGRPAGEKASEMAMPTLIGLDGRRAIPAFTSLDSMRSWQADARPVPVAAGGVWRAAVADSCAVVVDIAGPVPVAVEGARLAALARGEAAPAPFADPDVREIVAEALSGHLDVAGFDLQPGDDNCDLVIVLTASAGGSGNSGADVTKLATQVGNAVMARLAARLRRGVAVALSAP
jgi:hypothetical protein